MGDCCSFGVWRRKEKSQLSRTRTQPTQLPESLSGPSGVDFTGRALWYALGLQMTDMASVKEQLKPIILKSLRITDLTPEDLRDDQPLIGGELEIDSIDILQLVLEIERHFGIKLVQANFNQKHLESVNALAAIIESKVAEART
jgi:acyl carrier protein